MLTLDDIAIKHGTDKSSKHHNYCVVYERFFSPIRDKELVVIELGYGGYHFIDRGGQGLKTWNEYFHNSRIYSVDVHDKDHDDTPRAVFYQGSQVDDVFLNKMIDAVGDPDIIIDDASHNSPMTVKSFEILFPRLKSGGLYVIEDLETSYWDDLEYQGGLHNPDSTINRFKSYIDNVNHAHSGLPDMGIKALMFFEKLIFIEKR